VADNYIALFSRFIACGTYEATYILDALLQNLSDVQPNRVHADTHGQSAAVFGLAYLLGIELTPRIRRWQSLTLYRSDNDNRYSKINSLFSGTVNWALIHEHYPQFMQLALAIQSGTLAPSAVLARGTSTFSMVSVITIFYVNFRRLASADGCIMVDARLRE
jgi:TnpA family transposase